MLGLRLRARAARQPAERQVAQRALIAFADQLEHARALGDVVVRLRQPSGGPVAARRGCAEILPTRRAWRARRCVRRPAKACFGFSCAIGRQQRFARDQIRLNGLGRRRADGGDFVGEPQRFFRGAAPRRELGLQHADRPFVPLAGLRAVSAVGFAGLAKVIAGRFVAAAHQRDLRERVEDRAGNFVKLNWSSDLQRAMEHLFGALELPKPAPESVQASPGEMRQAAAGADLFLQRGAALGQAPAPARGGAG